MLSYNTVNGQRPSSSGTIPPSPKAARLPTTTAATSLSNGVLSNGAVSMNDVPAKAQHIWLVTGPAGCGKSTVAKHIADSLQMPFIEGDEYHPKANIDKMSAGIPLTDADRWDWLTALREASITQLNSRGQAGGSVDGVVLTCSALKRKYRDVIRVAPYFAPNLHLHFIYLDADEELLLARVAARKNHYMGANMVHSQFEVLERPGPDEVDVLTVDVARSAEEVMAEALEKVLRTMERVGPEGRE